jgi:3-oxoacyl-[acyl-carrier protein] reductase
MSRNSIDLPYIVAAMTRFEKKTVLVTGGARGIGAATAKRFASEGATVVVADFDEAAAQETAQAIGGHAVRCDVTKREDVEAAVEAAVSHGGSLDVLITCAGIIRDNMLFKMSDEDWDAVIDTHLKGTFFAVRAAQKQMVEQKSGKIVLISSTSALGNRGQVNYSTAKAGLQGMTKTLAIELGPFNVNVNCVAPGFIATAMTQQTADRMGVPFEQFMEAAAAQVPLRRVGQPEDVAGTIAYLCSEDAGYVSGQVIYVAGGPRN